MRRDLFGPRYPRSVLSGTAAEAFGRVLEMHLPPGGSVLDPTYGEGLSWVGIPIEMRAGDVPGEAGKPGLFATDLKFGQDVTTLLERRPDLGGKFDLVYFDPPYFAGVEASDDPRAEAYGGYVQTFKDLANLIDFTPRLAMFLKPNGKLILKCGDQYHVPTRTFYAHHLEWAAAVRRGFKLVDFYVYPYHRVSPTAYQVKDRPCAVVSHSYFIVGEASPW